MIGQGTFYRGLQVDTCYGGEHYVCSQSLNSMLAAL